jgi:hypothetical protein
LSALGFVIAGLLALLLPLLVGIGSYRATGSLGQHFARGAKDRRFILDEVKAATRTIAIWTVPIALAVIGLTIAVQGFAPGALGMALAFALIACGIIGLPCACYILGRLCGMAWRGIVYVILYPVRGGED